MKSTIVKPALSVLFILIVLSANAQLDSTHIRSEWKAGVARVLITPEQPMWAAGYAARDHQIDSILHDLWVKALAIEDGEGSKALMISADLLGFPKALSDGIRDRLEKEYELSRAQIILSGTHTHSGPVLEDALYDIYPLDAQDIPIIEQYSGKLADQIVALAGEALSSMEPVQIYAQNGVTRFQVNRRNNDASTLDAQSELKGPSDHAVPVIKVVDQEGNIMAVTFGYACHPTVLDQYEWSGDYPGFSMIELERLYPGTTALFFSGAGADQNPLPRRSIGLAKQYGKELAAAVERVLEEDMRELSPTLAVGYSEIELPLNPPPSLNELHEYAEAPEDYVRRWAEKMIDKMEQEESFINSYPYPLQVWHMGDQMLVNMGGEVVVEYAIKLKQIFGQDIFVFAYSNDEVAYIPSVTIIEEGGYEGLISQMVYGLPGTWKVDIESMIIQEIVRLAGKNGTQEQNANVPTALSGH